MNWHDLLFMHWPVPPEALRQFIPQGLELDVFADESGHEAAWIAIVPFTMTGVRARFTPALPWLGAFHELNVRTYVRMPGPDPGDPASRPGVWFFSLDAANPVAVATARRTFHLNYCNARISLTRNGDGIHYASTRTHHRQPPAQLEATYRPTGPMYHASRGSLEYWFTERYCLYSDSPRGHIYRADIHHAPWPLHPAQADVRVNTMTGQLGLTLPDTPPILHFAQRLDVAAWLPERVGA